MEHSNIQLKSNIVLDDYQKVDKANTYSVSYVNFEGKQVTYNYVRHNNNKKE